MQKFTRLPVDAFTHLQLNAGILVDDFNPVTGVIGNIMGATTGGINFQSNPTFSDFGEDVDNCPANMMELKHLDSFDPTMNGTFLTCTPAIIKMLVAAGDVDAGDSTRVIPRSQLETGDFVEVWWIGDYSDTNTGDNAGFLAIHLMRALNQSGFQIQSTKNGKGNMSFEFHGHYTMSDQETVPFEIYCKEGESSSTPSVNLNTHAITIGVDDEVQLVAGVIPSGQTVTWSSSASGKASVTNAGLVKGLVAGSTIITASITVDGVSYTDTCTVVVS